MLQNSEFAPICATALFEPSGPISTITINDDLLLMTLDPEPDPTLSHAMTPTLPITWPQSHPEASLLPDVQLDASQGQNMESFVTIPLTEKGINSEPACSFAPDLCFKPVSLH